MALKGSAAAVAEAVQAAGPVRRAAVQQRLPLAEAGALALALDENPGNRVAAVKEARRRGRPRGSRNRRSEDLARFILSRYAHPLEVLAQTYSRPVEDLAAQLGCEPAAAMALQVRCAAEALPYFESKKPVAVQVDTRMIQLVIAQGEAAGDGLALPPWERLAGMIAGPDGTIDGTKAGDDD